MLSIRDHPRRCGENSRLCYRPHRRLGSPPQVRGKHFDSIAETADGRITPAGAGKTSVAIGTGVCNRDHPRRCGENCWLHQLCFASQGSPPQVRGKRFSYTVKVYYTRITPAGAGKTCYAVSEPPVAQDHPRRCGENAPPVATLSVLAGSPPQVRGKPHRDYIRQKEDRITPAGAGKTLKRSFRNQPFCS